MISNTAPKNNLHLMDIKSQIQKVKNKLVLITFLIITTGYLHYQIKLLSRLPNNLNSMVFIRSNTNAIIFNMRSFSNLNAIAGVQFYLNMLVTKASFKFYKLVMTPLLKEEKKWAKVVTGKYILANLMGSPMPSSPFNSTKKQKTRLSKKYTRRSS